MATDSQLTIETALNVGLALRLALHHVPYMAMAGFHFPKTVEKTAQTGTTPEGIRSVL